MERMHYNVLEMRDASEEEYQAGYQDADGRRYHGSSDVKNLMAVKIQDHIPPTDAMDFGSMAHRWLASHLDPKRRPFEVLDPFMDETGKILRSNSNDYKARRAEAEKKHGKGNFEVLRASEMKEWIRTAPGLAEYVDGIPSREGWVDATRHVERAFLISAPQLEVGSCKTPILERLRAQLAECGGFNVKAMPDLVLERADACTILDWKKTSKESPTEMAWQAENLGYWFSVYYYAMAVELVMRKPVESVELVFLPMGKDALVRFRRGLDEEPVGWDMAHVDGIGARVRKGLVARKRRQETGLLDCRLLTTQEGKPSGVELRS